MRDSDTRGDDLDRGSHQSKTARDEGSDPPPGSSGSRLTTDGGIDDGTDGATDDGTDTAAPAADEAAGGGDDEESFFEMHSYDFNWYYTKTLGWRTALKATVLLVGSFVVLPGLVLLGYMYRVGQAAARGAETPPPLEDWQALAKDGARFLVLVVPGFFLMLIPVLGLYIDLAIFAAYVGTGSLTDSRTYVRGVRLMFSVSYLVWFVEFLVYLSAMWIITFLAIGVGWVLGPGFVFVSSGAFLGYVYHQGAEEGIVPEPAEASA